MAKTTKQEVEGHMSEKLCWFCKHFYWSNADYGYSELTPGYDLSIQCNKNHWTFGSYKTRQLKFAKMINSAKTCDDFVLLESLK